MKFAYKYRQSIAFALYVALLMSTAAPAVMARPQVGVREGAKTGVRAAQASASATTVAQNRTKTWRDKLQETGRMIPASIPVRSTKGVKGFAGGTRLQVGGAFGSNVQEQVVDITNFTLNGVAQVSDERHPFWSSDEQTIFFSSNLGGGAYQLFRITANASPNPATPGTAALAITSEAGANHDFPALNSAGNRLAYIKSVNGGPFHLYQALIPAAGGTIPAQTTAESLTFGRTLGAETITSVGRPSWLSGTEIVFAATFSNSGRDLVVVDIQSRLLRRLTTGTATEENVAVSPDGNFVAFDSNATVYNGAASGGTGTVRNVFVVNTAGTAVTQITNVDDLVTATPRVAADTVSSEQPAWSRSNVVPIFNTQAQYFLAFASNRQANPAFDPTNPNPAQPAYNSAATRDIFYVPAIFVDQNAGTRVINQEQNPAQTRKLDTRDEGLRWDDQFPTFPPLINLQRLGFQSNRKGSSAGVFTPHNPADQNDLFIASLIDITAPTLLRYDLSRDGGEVVHVNLGNTFSRTATVRSRADGITPNTQLFFTVRAEDLEAGVQSVYVQFKNPNSKYQAAAQGGAPTEHKEYRAESGVRFGLGAFTILQPLDGGLFPLYLQEGAGTTIIGSDFVVQPDNLGVEYEAEVVSVGSSQKSNGNANYFQHRFNRRVTNAPVGLGGMYEAGVDDLSAFSGSRFAPPLDPTVADDPNVANDNGIWLKLEPLPQAQQDNNGGVLYGASWTIPGEASDWYMDVILYDNAINPFSDPTNPDRSNWIIYDNVWGFSSAIGLGGDNVNLLFVSDYTLGQKFVKTRFGDPESSAGLGANPFFNLPLQQYGAESYYIDRDLDDRLDGRQAPSAPVAVGGTPVVRVWDDLGPFLRNTVDLGLTTGPGNGGTANPLGFGSYVDDVLIGDSVQDSGVFLPSVGRYSTWRILSRGPVPANILSDYLPAPGVRPPDTRIDPRTIVLDDPATPINEASGGTPYEQNTQNISVVNRMVIWAAPFAATSFRGSGAIVDNQTQTDLRTFVQNGGKLFLAGQDVA
ncbi:MAG: PD40 domain-containing protein, partial [Fibrella sp.]|nr:PD40 domain-containing protein [Armatimonadota bacterium]